jgi:hypothetical protein
VWTESEQKVNRKWAESEQVWASHRTHRINYKICQLAGGLHENGCPWICFKVHFAGRLNGTVAPADRLQLQRGQSLLSRSSDPTTHKDIAMWQSDKLSADTMHLIDIRIILDSVLGTLFDIIANWNLSAMKIDISDVIYHYIYHIISHLCEKCVCVVPLPPQQAMPMHHSRWAAAWRKLTLTSEQSFEFSDRSQWVKRLNPHGSNIW